MSHNPYAFAKGYQERLQDFNRILSESLKATAIEKQLIYYAECSIEPLGWQAMWKLSPDTCATMNIKFPCVIIVVVEQVNFNDLSCLVSTREVEDDNIYIPDKLTDVPLIELYPTTEQDSSAALSMYETAELIDILRFFYNHLWMPWDLELDEDNSWVSLHLEGRLQLYFSMAESKELSHTVHKLVADSRRIQHQIEDLRDGQTEVSPDILLQLTELNNCLSNLKNEYAIYEKPDLLKALMMRNQNREKLQQHQQIDTIVLSITTPERFLKMANLITQLTSDKRPIRYLPSLQDALVKAAAGSSVWVTQGKYVIKDLGNLEAGGTLMGVEPGVLVTDEAGRCSTIELLKGSVTMTSVTLHMTTSWNIITVRPGVECCLNEMRLEGSTVTDGVDVYPGAKLSANNCHFSLCRTAIICYNESTVVLSNCTFTDNSIALELRKGCNLNMENCVISGSKLYGVDVYAPRPLHSDNISIECINSIPQLKESGTIWKENTTNLHFNPVTWNESINQNGTGSVTISQSE